MISLFKHPSYRISTVTLICMSFRFSGSHCCGASILISFFFGDFFNNSFFPLVFGSVFPFDFDFGALFFCASFLGAFLDSFVGDLALESLLDLEIGFDLLARLFVFSFYFDFFISGSFCFFDMKFNLIVGAGWPAGSLLKKFVNAIGFGFGLEHGLGYI